MNDFEYAFKNDIKPAFGVKDNKLQQFIVNGIIEWSSKIKKILADGSDLTITAAQGMINGGASFRWSFGPLSAWGSIESTTILTTHPSL